MMQLDVELHELTKKKLNISNDYIEIDEDGTAWKMTKKEYDDSSGGKFQLFSGKHYCMPFLDESQRLR